MTALRVVDATGAKVTESRFTTEPVSLAKGASTVGLSFPELDMSALPDGQYSIVAIARPADGIRSERIQDLDLDFPNYLSATIADGHIKFQAPEMSVLSSTAPVVNGQFYCDARSCIRATLGNNGGTAYNGTVAMALTDISTGRIVAKGDAFTKDVQPGQSVDIELTSVFNVQPGRYGLVITDRSGHKVSPVTEIEAMEACEGSPIASSGPDFGDNNRVNPLAVNASAVITATPGTAFSGYLYLYIYKDGSEDVAGSLGPVFAQASGGSETKVIFDGRFENGQPGQSYEARLVNGENFTYVTPRDVATTQFTIDGGASIEFQRTPHPTTPSTGGDSHPPPQKASISKSREAKPLRNMPDNQHKFTFHNETSTLIRRAIPDPGSGNRFRAGSIHFGRRLQRAARPA